MEPIVAELLENLDLELERLERCLDRLDETKIWIRLRPGVNAVGNLCLHLAGNESHYVGRLIGGRAYVRDRSAEFRCEGGLTRADLREKLHAARAMTREVLAGLEASDLERTVPSDYPPRPTVLRVLLHVAEHYAYHTGQAVLLTRILQEGEAHLLEWRH